MNLLSLYNMNPDILMAITSIFAVLISIISMIFTIVFSVLQIKHNKNSVRPISAIIINSTFPPAKLVKMLDSSSKII